MKGIRILYLGGATGIIGGIERYAYQTANLLRKNGAQVHWCGLAEDTAPYAEEFQRAFDRLLVPGQVLTEQDKYDIIALHKLPKLDILLALRQKFGQRLVFWVHDHDLYCPCRHYYTPFGRVNCQRHFSPLRCWCCSHCTWPRNWKDLHWNHFHLLNELRAHRVVALSQFMVDNLLRNGFEKSKIHLFPPAIRVFDDKAVSFDASQLNIIFLGQLIRGKGADLMLQALADLKVPWNARFLGDGKDLAFLQHLANHLGIASRVDFLGWQKDTSPHFVNSNVAVFPSRWQEPFGLAGAEALAHGLPVVAFDVGAVREWLRDGETGYVVPAQDTKAMTTRLEELFRTPTLAQQMGLRGREDMRVRFSAEKFLERMQALVEELRQ